MKKFILILASIVLVLCSSSMILATEDDTQYLYTDEDGNLVESDYYEYDDDSILIDSEEDYNDLYNQSTQESQAELKEAFDLQTQEFSAITTEDEDERLVITDVLSDIKSEYTTDYYYYYIVKYQLVKVRNEEGKETSGVVVHSYDVSDNQNIKPLKAGDVVYGYIEYITTEDSTYNMVNHGLTDSEIAFVSVSVQERNLGVILLSIFTILLLILYAGKHGTKLLIPTFVAIDLLFIVLVPEIALGKNIILLASLIALELIILISVLKNGWSTKTLVSVISSIIVVILVGVLGFAFGDANGLSGKGILTEENYDLLTNVYYIDQLFKTTINVQHIYIAIIILISSVIAASISSKLVDLSEKYAGTKDMINSIIEEGKGIICEYPMIITIIFLVMSLPSFMIMSYNNTTFYNLINSDTLVTNLSLLLITLISSLIISPITAIISGLFMGTVEVKQISDKK